MSRKITPMGLGNFPHGISTNCLGFSIGYTTPVRPSDDLFVLDHKLPIAQAFLEKLKEMGYHNLPKQIQSLDEAKENEFVFMVFDFTEYPVSHPIFGSIEIHWDYHVIRRELDGTWVHKPGWYDSPCKIRTDKDWEDLYAEFGRKCVLFALAG